MGTGERHEGWPRGVHPAADADQMCGRAAKADMNPVGALVTVLLC